jgi:hypothetical protein
VEVPSGVRLDLGGGETMMMGLVVAAALVGQLVPKTTEVAELREQAEAAPRTYQLRTYFTAPGKLPVLMNRFATVNVPIFKRLGIRLEGAWVPLEPDEAGDRLVYLVSFQNRADADAAWVGFNNNPEWIQAAAAEKAEHGTVVERTEFLYLQPTDYSPKEEVVRAETEKPGHVYEMRIYTASPGKLEALNARFREHTLGLFARHGMTNVLYTEPLAGQPGAGSTLLYWMAYPDRESAAEAWKGFQADPEWQKVRDASQADGVKLAAGVKSLFLKPAIFSPMK